MKIRNRKVKPGYYFNLLYLERYIVAIRISLAKMKFLLISVKRKTNFGNSAIIIRPFNLIFSKKKTKGKQGEHTRVLA